MERYRIGKIYISRTTPEKTIASIFCSPSYAEGFPMAVLDAWAYSLPVITTPVGGIPDVAKNEENMLVFDSGNTNKLQNKYECLKNNR